MKIYYPHHPRDVKHYDTKQLRDDFLIDSLFTRIKLLLLFRIMIFVMINLDDRKGTFYF